MTIVPGAQRALHLLSSGRFSEIGAKVGKRLRTGPYKTYLGYGLRRDLNAPLVAPQAKIPIEVREFRDSDAQDLLAGNADPKEQWEVDWRREVVAMRLPTCYVAVDQRNGTPCYMQWLTGAEHNGRLAAVGPFPTLERDEALLENAFTPPAYRGMGIMSAAMAMIAERGRDIGARFVITFVDFDNAASLKGCERAGFFPYVVRRQTQYGFGLVRTVDFEPLDTAPGRSRSEAKAAS